MKRSVVHSSTFSQGSFAMAAGLAALNVLDRENIIFNAAKMGDFIGQGLRALVSRFEFMKEVRWRGLMIGIEFGSPKFIALKIAWTTCHTLDNSLFPQAAVIPLMDKHHIITQIAGHGVDVVKLLPPLIINDADAKWFLTAFEDVMVQVHKFPGPAWDVLTGIGKMAITQRARQPRSVDLFVPTSQFRPLRLQLARRRHRGPHATTWCLSTYRSRTDRRYQSRTHPPTLTSPRHVQS